MVDNARVPVPGSERKPVPFATAVAEPDPDQRIEVTMLLRSRQPDAAQPDVAALAAALPAERQNLTREEFAARFSAASDDVAQVEAFARDNDLDVVDISLEQRTVVLAGTVAELSQAFAVELHVYEGPQGRYRGRTGAVHVPASLDGIVLAVLGLDDRPQARPHFRRLDPPQGAFAAHATSTSFSPVELAKLYDFPTDVDGSGQSVAIIELDGGFRDADLKAYFTRLGRPTPKVSAVSVGGARNKPTTAASADTEVMLDIEVVGGVAPGAEIVVYFAPNTTAGFLRAITTAAHDTHHRPSVISISWGAPESGWTAQALDAYDRAFADAAAMGVTVCCASGDDGSSDRVNDGQAHVDFPASSPHVLACGGTRLNASGGQVTSEVVWNDGPGGGATGGGVSAHFGLPAWQQSAHVPPSVNDGRPGRGVPDISGDADPQTGYQVRVDGTDTIVGGTSAVAPLWAGLAALFNQKLGTSVGFLNPLLYGPLAGSPRLRDVTVGNNGAYQAAAGWDPCTGLGSPDGEELLTKLAGKG